MHKKLVNSTIEGSKIKKVEKFEIFKYFLTQ